MIQYVNLLKINRFIDDVRTESVSLRVDSKYFVLQKHTVHLYSQEKRLTGALNWCVCDNNAIRNSFQVGSTNVDAHKRFQNYLYFLYSPYAGKKLFTSRPKTNGQH